MIKTSDNAIISSAHSSSKKEDKSFRSFSLLRARVEDVIYTDDERNQNGQFVEYNIIIDGTQRDGAKYFSVPALTFLGGINNYSETIFDKTTHNFTAPLADGRTAYNIVTNGSYVAVLFLYAYDENPVIIGNWPHPRKIGAKKEDGVRMKGEFNGIEWNIDKEGAFTITSLGGPRTPRGELTNDSRGPSSITIESDGTIKINKNDNRRVIINNDIIELTDSSDTNVRDGVITGNCLDPFLGINHIDFSQKIRGKK